MAVRPDTLNQQLPLPGESIMEEGGGGSQVKGKMLHQSNGATSPCVEAKTKSWFVSCEQWFMRNVQTLSHGQSQQAKRPSH
ncbi:hypothetical protein CDAR_485541 [Caerostris darwini]|uniref:Uncharacterized protein n=1 Tax=Caerostris darwini TaxID=1538125 RepID=A0AAV4W9S7_9ARAC|nr:hypothetical protein CDAR_485541 [Caerostris darwini]